MKAIITHTDSFYNKRITLDGLSYTFYFHWEHRQGVWLLDINDAQGNPVIQSQKLVEGVPLLRNVKYMSNCPPGELMLFSLDQSTDAPPGIADMDYANGGRSRLIYLSAADVAALKAGTPFSQLGND